MINYLGDDIFLIDYNTKLFFHNNPFLNGLPDELVNKEDIWYIKFYLDSFDEVRGVKKLFETKILVVGKGNSGKTSFIKLLKDSNFKLKLGEEETTKGIIITEIYEKVDFPARQPYYNIHEDFDKLYTITDWEEILDEENISVSKEKFYLSDSILADPSNSGEFVELRISDSPNSYIEDLYFSKNVRLNIWDFGGQEILYSTHQFFLTQRSLYIFLWEPRADDESESFDYWLNVIGRLSNNCPVIVVMNKSDIRVKSIDEITYKSKYPNIVDFFEISCLTKEGITELKESIKETIPKLKQIGAKLPYSWDDIRKNISNIKKRKDYISLSEFREICKVFSENDLNFLSEYLNDIGDIIHFRNDIMLNDLIVVNPDWLTSAIYDLIYSLKIQKNKGLFNLNNLNELLDIKKYPPEKHFQIISLMEKFEIVFKVIGSSNEYVIPTLLNASIPEEIKISDFKNSKSLKYHIHYNFMPSGIIERLICRLNTQLGKDYFWKYGAVFTNEYSSALVTLDKGNKLLELNVVGSYGSQIYSAIISAISEIHTDLKLKEVDFTEKYACICSDCSQSNSPYMIPKKVLNKFLKNKKKKIDCYKTSNSVDIEQLLIGYKSVSQKKSLIRDFTSAFSQLQSRVDLIKGYNENQITTYLQDLLRPKLEYGLFLNEQSLKGISYSGSSQGELDMVIEESNGNSITFFEGFILNYLDKKNIHKHLIKTINNYDVNGLKEKFIGIYSRAKNFNNLSRGYLKYIERLNVNNGITLTSLDISDTYSKGAEMKIYKSHYEKNNYLMTIYHILINVCVH